MGRPGGQNRTKILKHKVFAEAQSEEDRLKRRKTVSGEEREETLEKRANTSQRDKLSS